MIHTIENNLLICQIESVGAEIRSLQNKKTKEEYIWQINSNIWSSSSPVLFPTIGNVKDNKILYMEQSYQMSKHGIIRNNENLEFKQLSKSKCSFTLQSSLETKKKYPFNFEFTVFYELSESQLTMTYTIKNCDQDTLLFTCGGHTAYSILLDKSSTLSDYVIEFPNQNYLVSETLNDTGLLGYQKRKYLLNNNSLELSETLFNEDALIFTNVDFNWVRLKKKNHKKGVVVKFKGYPNLALWSKPKANYICIEPWLGLPDREDETIDLSKKTTYQKIKPSKSFCISIETVIES